MDESNEPVEREVSREDFVGRAVEETMAHFAALLPEDIAAEIRGFLEDVLTTHPVGSTLVERARPRVAPERSGEVMKDGSEGSEEGVIRRRGGAG